MSPAAGPLTLVCDPLRSPTTTPPTMPASTPEMGGAPEATATPTPRGRVTRNTTNPARRSRGAVVGENARAAVELIGRRDGGAREERPGRPRACAAQLRGARVGWLTRRLVYAHTPPLLMRTRASLTPKRPMHLKLQIDPPWPRQAPLRGRPLRPQLSRSAPRPPPRLAQGQRSGEEVVMPPRCVQRCSSRKASHSASRRRTSSRRRVARLADSSGTACISQSSLRCVANGRSWCPVAKRLAIGLRPHA